MATAQKRANKSTKATKTTTGIEKSAAGSKPRCLKVASKGIRTGADFAAMMSMLMSDVVEGSISPGIANATCNAGGKLLKVVEMQIKYGVTTANGAEKKLTLLTGQK